MWISSHNIHSLSVLCVDLMKDPSFIDQFFLHTTIPSLIEPLREFLDTWTIDEEDDNGEHQVIYEQYNSILFFICYCVHHYGREIALDDPDGPGFVRTWLREFSKAKWLDMLSDEDSNAIGTWITALFDGDGISDDLVRFSLPRTKFIVG
jgi:Mediator complex subunit Med5